MEGKRLIKNILGNKRALCQKLSVVTRVLYPRTNHSRTNHPNSTLLYLLTLTPALCANRHTHRKPIRVNDRPPWLSSPICPYVIPRGTATAFLSFLYEPTVGHISHKMHARHTRRVILPNITQSDHIQYSTHAI